MLKRITATLAVLTAAFAFNLAAWGADQNGAITGTAAEKAPAQAQKTGCSKCNLKGAVKTQANTGKAAKHCKDCKCSKKGKPCNKNCKDCPSAADCKTRKNCTKVTKDGKPCPTGCIKKAGLATK